MKCKFIYTGIYLKYERSDKFEELIASIDKLVKKLEKDKGDNKTLRRRVEDILIGISLFEGGEYVIEKVIEIGGYFMNFLSLNLEKDVSDVELRKIVIDIFEIEGEISDDEFRKAENFAESKSNISKFNL